MCSEGNLDSVDSGEAQSVSVGRKSPLHIREDDSRSAVLGSAETATLTAPLGIYNRRHTAPSSVHSTQADRTRRDSARLTCIFIRYDYYANGRQARTTYDPCGQGVAYGAVTWYPDE